MIIGHRTIKVTDAEFEALGDGLVYYLTSEMQIFSSLDVFLSSNKTEIDLLDSFQDFGYRLQINGNVYTDAYEWAHAKHKEVWQQKN